VSKAERNVGDFAGGILLFVKAGHRGVATDIYPASDG
jgi:hypothetical protein